MAVLLYTLGLRSYELIIRVAALFNPKAKAFINGRKQVWQSLDKQLENNTGPVIWIHCSSVGEYEQGRPLMEAIKMKFPTNKILVSFYSPSGYQTVEPDEIVDVKIYLPFDSRKNARRLIDKIKPNLALFIKYEFWHFYLTELKAKNIPTFSISSIFRPEQVYFKWYGEFYRNILKNFSFFFVQDQTSYHMLQKLNIPCTVTGDTRLDRVIAIREQRKLMPEIAAFIDGNESMIVGSMRKEDIDIIIDFVKRHPDLKFIIAPHEIKETMMQPLENELSSTVRHSNLSGSTQNDQVLIIDNIGMLSQLYRYANYAYIGGGFSDGLHNILEPAVYEIPVFFGNKDYQRFKEAIDLIDLGSAFPVGSIHEFETVFNHLQHDPEQQSAIASSLRHYLESNQGAADKILDHLSKYLS
jgi:3-deoxy-D-manno-octulosonic-acid transferase